MKSQSGAGGSAAAGGFNFQHRVSAWFATRILAEGGAEPILQLPSPVIFESFRCETRGVVDDLQVVTSRNGLLLGQVKKTVSMSAKPDSPLASALDQFAREYIGRRGGTNDKLWERPLDPTTDRLMLIIGPDTSHTIRTRLRDILDRLRDLPNEDSIGGIINRRILSTVRDHLKRSLASFLGQPSSESDVRNLLQLIHVLPLDVEADGTNEREATQLLQTVVLRNSGEAGKAWSALLKCCALCAEYRSGTDRAGLQAALEAEGIPLAGVYSYRDEIEKLLEYTGSIRSLLSPHSIITLHGTEIKITRPCVEALTSAASEGQLLVVGAPGAGKTGALCDLTNVLASRGHDVVFIAADRYEESALERTDRILLNWPGTSPAFLIIDALDAARDERVQRSLKDLVRSVIASKSRWRVIASIREFDLRYNEEIKLLFRGEPPASAFCDPAFSGLRHVRVPGLSEEELDQVKAQSVALGGLISASTPDLKELLRTPFHLWLIADLMESGVPEDELSPLRTRVGLLDRYWSHRVISDDGKRDTREQVLRRACVQMVATGRLRVGRTDVTDAAPGDALHCLLSNHVLVASVPPLDTALAFPHHVVFDYAVMRLLLDADPVALSRLLSEHKDWVIRIWPSLSLLFQEVWVHQRSEEFWNLVFSVSRSSTVSEIAKTIGPTVACEMAVKEDEIRLFDHLIASLRSETAETIQAAEKTFGHLAMALVAARDWEKRLVGADAGPWCSLLARVSEETRLTIAYPMRTMLLVACEKPELLTPPQRASLRLAAHRLFDFAWPTTAYRTDLVTASIEVICRTFEGAPGDSAATLRRTLEPDRLKEHGYQYAWRLAREIGRLVPVAPDLAGDIYKAIFGFNERSEEPTPMGSSQIMPLTSRRRQDYRLAYHQLSKAFPSFLRASLVHAVDALISVVESYANESHPIHQEVHEETFDFAGRTARLKTDFSHIWDGPGTDAHDDVLQMLRGFEHYLVDLAASAPKSGDITAAINIIVNKNCNAAVWRRLLSAARQRPETLGTKLIPLAFAVPVLAGMDTGTLAGDYIHVLYPFLRPADRERIEIAVLSIPTLQTDPDRREAGEHIRNRLFGCIPRELVTTDAGKALIDALTAANAVPPNKPPYEFLGATSVGFSEEEFLSEIGHIPVKEEQNRHIIELWKPVKEFAEKNLNEVPKDEDARNILSPLVTLYRALLDAEAAKVHVGIQENGWGYLASACEKVSRIKAFPDTEDLARFTLGVLLEASRNPCPSPNPDMDAQFDSHPMWGTPAPRIHAAEGLMRLSAFPSYLTTEVRAAIDTLSTDPVPAVRFHVATGLLCLYHTDREFMWNLVGRLSEDRSRGVVGGLLSPGLWQLIRAHNDRLPIVKTILGRITDGPGAEEVRDGCVHIFQALYLWKVNADSRDVLFALIHEPARFEGDCRRIVVNCRELLSMGPIDPPDKQQDEVRARAFDLVKRILTSAREGFMALQEKHSGEGWTEWPKEDIEQGKNLAELLRTVCTELYFSSGAFDEKQKPETALPLAMKRRFYSEASELLDILSGSGFVQIDHELIETLQAFIPVDPEGVFLRIGRVVEASRKAGYQYESLAADLMVSIVERYLAQYRLILKESEPCRNVLIQILDTFVGWPSARKLTYRLEEIFR